MKITITKINTNNIIKPGDWIKINGTYRKIERIITITDRKIRNVPELLIKSSSYNPIKTDSAKIMLQNRYTGKNLTFMEQGHRDNLHCYLHALEAHITKASEEEAMADWETVVMYQLYDEFHLKKSK